MLDSNYCIIDFETRCKLPIKKGAYHYVNHPSFEVICMGLRFKESKPLIIKNKKTILNVCKKLLKFSKVHPIVAHNAVFDFYVFQRITKCSMKPYKNWIDSRLLSSFSGGPVSLDECANFFELSNKKDPLGNILKKILTVPFSEKTPKYYKKLKCSEFVDEKDYVSHPLILKDFYEYCERDILTCEELYLKLEHQVKYITQKTVKIDVGLNRLRNKKGLRVDLKTLKLMKAEGLALGLWIDETIQKLTHRGFKVNSPGQIQKFLKSYNIHLISTGAGHIKKLLKTKIPDKIRKLLLLVMARPKVSLKKIDRMIEESYNGRICGNFIYAGAGKTCRYKSVGINPLNFPQGSLEAFKTNLKLMNPKITTTKNFFTENSLGSADALSAMIRHTVVADNIFYGADFKQIDFRLLLLASGHYKILKMLYKGFDVYKYFASKIYRKDGNKVSKRERAVCKKIVLGAGYGQGGDTLLSQVLLEGIDATLNEVSQIRSLYFMMFPKVQLFWKKMEGQMQNKNALIVPFFNKKIDLRHWDKTRCWGGSLTGDCIQAMTSCLLNFTIRNLWFKMKLMVDFPFHDAVISDVPYNTDFKLFQKTVETAPSCLPKKYFPYIQCEYWKGRRFR